MEFIDRAFELTEAKNPLHLESVLNRPAGSQWGYEVKCWQEIASLEWKELEAGDRIKGLHLACCRYFTAKRDWGVLSILDEAVEAIALLSEFEDFGAIEIYEGTHGPELRARNVAPSKTQVAQLITGPGFDVLRNPVEGDMVWTAYPGRITASLQKHPEWDGTRGCLEKIARGNLPIAVKGVA